MSIANRAHREEQPGRLDPHPGVSTLARNLVALVLTAHLAFAALYWWLMPKGFPVDNRRFWLYSLLPIVAFVVTAIGRFELFKRRYHLVALSLVCCAASWIAIAISARVLFPWSLQGVWLACLAPAGAALFGIYLLRREARLHVAVWLPAALLCAIAGWFSVRALLPPDPTTRPIGDAVLVRGEDAATDNLPPFVQLGENYRFFPDQEAIELSTHGVTIRCRPLLSFHLVSPDRFWSVLAPRRTKSRSLQGHSSDGSADVFHYNDGSTVALSQPTATGELALTASSAIQRDTFSHLNTFCVLDVSGHDKLTLTFSPCPETPIEIVTADYPIGRPARFAYVDANQTFSIVEASSGEKGPFHPIASGTLGREEALTITFQDDGRPIASVVLEDWSPQLSTALSPTAGWEVPVNAIEFQRHGTADTAPASVWITLAATSVGRGWDTAGHSAGTYRNRMAFRVESR